MVVGGRKGVGRVVVVRGGREERVKGRINLLRAPPK